MTSSGTPCGALEPPPSAGGQVLSTRPPKRLPAVGRATPKPPLRRLLRSGRGLVDCTIWETLTPALAAVDRGQVADRHKEGKSQYTLDRQNPGAFEGETVTRRRFMDLVTNGAGAVAAAAFTLPALGFAIG